MDFASSTRARWKGIVANSSVVPRQPSTLMGKNRTECISFNMCILLCPVYASNCIFMHHTAYLKPQHYLLLHLD